MPVKAYWEAKFTSTTSLLCGFADRTVCGKRHLKANSQVIYFGIDKLKFVSAKKKKDEKSSLNMASIDSSKIACWKINLHSALPNSIILYY